MPTMAPRGCSDRTCNKLVSGKGRTCPDHAKGQGRVDYAARGSRAERGYPANWDKLRDYVLARDPICKLCTNELSNTVDHVTPLARGGTNDPSNLQGLGARCHSVKTNIERTTSNVEEVMRRARTLCIEQWGARRTADDASEARR